MSSASRLAWSAWVLTLALAALMCVFYVLGLEIALEDRDRPPLAFLPVVVLFLLAFSTVGAAVASHHPTNAIGWIFCSIGVVAGVGFSAQFYADYVLLAEPGSLPGGAVAVWLSLWAIVPLLTATTFAALLFPDGRLLSPRWRVVPWLALGGGVATMLGLALAPGQLDDRNHPGVENPVGIAGAETLTETVTTVGTGAALVALVLAVLSMILRFRGSTGIERQQLKWIAYSATLAAVSFIAVLPLNVSPWDDAVFVVAFVSLIAVPITAGMAIFRYRLYDIDVVINRTLVYGLLTASLAATYVGLVLLLQLAFTPVTEDSALAIAGSTLAVAALFRPARRRIQALVDRRFYRRKYDAALTLEAFSARLREEIDLDALRAELTGVVRETMQPAHISLWLRKPAR